MQGKEKNTRRKVGQTRAKVGEFEKKLRREGENENEKGERGMN